MLALISHPSSAGAAEPSEPELAPAETYETAAPVPGPTDSFDHMETRVVVGEQRAPCQDSEGCLPSDCPGWCHYSAPEPLVSIDTAPPKVGAGTVLGHHRLLHRLGEGGMGEVYLAEDTALRRKVAIKVVRPEYAKDLGVRGRFLTEARAMARVRHPSVLPILERGVWRGIPFLVMEWIDGTTLSQLLATLRGQPMPTQQAMAVLTAIGEGISAIHGAGAIHRDIKPANILRGTDGRIAIADFGLAMPYGPSCVYEGPYVMGTPTYMAPEIATGLAKGPSVAVDIYALAVIAFELFAGRPPFVDEDPQQIMIKQARDVPPALTELRPELPRALQVAIGAGLVKNPDARTPTAMGLIEAIHAALA